MKKHFIPLHTHSIYSFGDGVIKIPDYVQFAKSSGLPAIALTDHGVGYGIPEFIWECESHGIKPIVGAEMYVTPDFPMSKRGKEYRRSHHLTLLCKDQEGYLNLLYLLSTSQTEGFYYVPRVDKDTLRSHREGLIALSGCMSGEVPYTLRAGLDVPESVIRESLGSKRAREVFETVSPLTVLRNLMEQRAPKIQESGLSPDESTRLLNLVEQEEYYSAESSKAAKRIIEEYREIFGEDFYLEIQKHGIPGMSYVYRKMRELGEELGVERVATTDSHYLYPDDYILQSAMSSVRTKKPLGKSPLAIGPSFHIWSEEEARESFPADEIENTVIIANKVEPVHINVAPPYFIPDFYGKDKDSKALREMCYDALPLKYPNRHDDPVVLERLERELEIIDTMGFPSYFLIVADICRESRERNIMWVVRGSAAGSVVAYLTGITMIEPLKFNLQFERFLNPNRVNMPDVDLDYPDDTRSLLIQYTQQRYGEERVAHIGTYSMMKARSSLKDMARIIGIPYAISHQLSNMIPEGASLSEALKIEDKLRLQFEVGLQAQRVLKNPGATGAEALALLRSATRGNKLSGPELDRDYSRVGDGEWTIQEFLSHYNSARELTESRAEIRIMFDLALRVEGNIRQASIHAAGILVSDVPLVERVPVARAPSGSNILATFSQWDMDVIDKMGMLKIDFLGLRTLTHVRRTLNLIEETTGEKIGFWEIPYEYDPENAKSVAAYQLLECGDTTGVFQVEGAGMRGVLQEVKPRQLQEIADVLSLYRPGPMDFIPDYVAVKHGEREMECVHPALGEILKETNGVCVYQEQVMQIAQRVAGFSMGEADNLRRVIAKKKLDKMPVMEQAFKVGAVNNGFSSEEADAIWDSLIGFARYGFNRAHATSYALLTVVTAYLKANYPWQFWTELISTESGNTDKMGSLIREAKDQGYLVTPPDINKSQRETSLVLGEGGKHRIVIGLKEVKYVGDTAVAEILEARGDKEFEGVKDFLERCPFKKVNKRVIESLAKAGAFDPYLLRAQAIASADKMAQYGRRQQKDIRQPTLFSAEGEDGDDKPWLAQQWQDLPILEFEKEVLGAFVTEHPLSDIEGQMIKQGATPIGSIEPGQKGNVKVVGLIERVKKITTKKGDSMAFVTLTSPDGEVDVTVFPKEYENTRGLLRQGNIVLVAGFFNTHGGRHGIVAKAITEPN